MDNETKLNPNYNAKIIKEKKELEQEIKNLKNEARQFWKDIYLQNVVNPYTNLRPYVLADEGYKGFIERFIMKEND